MGAGRPPRPFDPAWHAAPDTPAPAWTPALVSKFIAAYWAARCSLRQACHKLRIPYRAAVAHRAADDDFADRLAWVERMYRERVREEFNRRVMDDPSKPANIIFDLKKRDPDYADAVDKKAPPIAIFIGDSALKREAIEAVEVKALPAGDA